MQKLLKIFNLRWEDNLIAYSPVISFLSLIWIIPCVYFFMKLKFPYSLLIFAIIIAYIFLYPIFMVIPILIAKKFGLFANVFVYVITNLLVYDVILILLSPPDFSTLGFTMTLLAAYYIVSFSLLRCFICLRPVWVLMSIPFLVLSVLLFFFPFSLYMLRNNILILFFVQFVYVYAISLYFVSSFMRAMNGKNESNL